MLQIYQEARPADYTKEEFEQYFRSAEGAKDFNTNVEYIMYGDFNRLEINLVDSFRKFRDISEYSRRWLGRRQIVLLYEINEEDKRLAYIQEKNGTVGFVEFGKNYGSGGYELQDQRFLVFSMLSFTNEVINCITDFEEFIKSVRQHILFIVDEAKSRAKADLKDSISVKCEVFGSFNTSEIALFFLCNEYVDALRLIEFIRGIFISVDLPNGEKTCKVFFNSFSFVSKNRYQEKNSNTVEGYHIEKEEDIKGKAIFQVSLKSGGGKQILNDIFHELHKPIREGEDNQDGGDTKESENFLDFGSVGEQDLITIIPTGRAMMYFQKKKDQADNNMGMLSFGKKEKYWKDQVRINIRLVYQSKDSVFDRILIDMEKEYFEIKAGSGSFLDKKENIEKIPPLSIPKIQLDENKRVAKLSEDIHDIYGDIRKEMKQFAQSVGAIDTLDLLYTDYLSMISYAYNAIWALDFQHQFYTILKVIKSILDSGTEKEEGDWNWESYRDLINNFKQQIYHLSQSNRAFLEIPTCHTRYTGQQDYLLHAYFGVVKKILQIVYLTHKHNQQSELVPLITVDVVPIVESTLYYEGKDSTECRVINLNIPNAIMFDFPRGVAYFIHEIYHYVAPYDRANRNQIFTCIMLTEIRLRQISRILKRMFDNETEKLALKKKEKECVQKMISLVIQCFREKVWEYFAGQYNKIREMVGDSETEPLIFSKLLLEIGKYAHKKEDEKFGIKVIFRLCLSELAEKSRGFEYNELYHYLDPNGKLEVACPEAVKIWLDVLKYYYIDKTELTFFLKRFQDDLIFSCDILEKDYEKIAQDVEWVYKRMWHGINEAVRDIAMIKILDMELAEYLIFVVQCWEDLHLKLEGNELSEQQICRLGSIFEYYELFKKEQKKESPEDYFQQQHILFCKRYLMLHYKTEGFQLQEIYQDAETRWEKMYKTKEAYLERYSYYDSYIQQNLFFYTDIKKTIQVQKAAGEKMATELASLCEEFKVQVTERYNGANQNFMEMFDISEDDSKSCVTLSEDYKEKYALYKKEIFACNLSIAHYYQKQEPIKELHHKYDNYQSQLEIKNPKERRIVASEEKSK